MESFWWKPILAGFINTTAVLLLVQGLKTLLPWLRQTTPWLLPVLAASAGPLVAAVQSWLAAWLGAPIDLSPLVAIFSGATATAVHQVGKQVTS
ncbi:MAG TPA: hypothetical protein VNJ53_07850 [Gaiellaceae bacterium]|nr:hypothetical protein [Gaiellaceae bacterium]